MCCAGCHFSSPLAKVTKLRRETLLLHYELVRALSFQPMLKQKKKTCTLISHTPYLDLYSYFLLILGLLRWEYNSGNPPISFTGTPFLIIGNTFYQCFFASADIRVRRKNEEWEKNLEVRHGPSQGPPRGTRNHAFTQVFQTNHAKKLPEIHVHAKFIQSR